MNPLFIRLMVAPVIALAASAIMAAAHASPMAEGDAQKIQLVIAAQLLAFEEDDADGAFETATPAVREAMGSSGLFLAMVRGAYPMVFRPASVKFHKPEQDEGTVLQLVEITDNDSKSWLALFALEQQPDSTWRISGCVVAENRWQPI